MNKNGDQQIKYEIVKIKAGRTWERGEVDNYKICFDQGANKMKMNENKEKSLMMQQIMKLRDQKNTDKVKLDAAQNPDHWKKKMEIGRMMIVICSLREGEAIMAIKREPGEL